MREMASVAQYNCDSSAVHFESQTRRDYCGTRSICAASLWKTSQVEHFIQSRLMSLGPVPVDFNRKHTRQASKLVPCRSRCSYLVVKKFRTTTWVKPLTNKQTWHTWLPPDDFVTQNAAIDEYASSRHPHQMHSLISKGSRGSGDSLLMRITVS